ncbi:hypothetical protein LCGC14_1028990 [marine sediment metagenome]|uniref:Uncharacterized protein n=1 Tax=marine sediment metagenome TaxID=412755 RepID=A0A0F9MV64_9ZZZZ
MRLNTYSNGDELEVIIRDSSFKKIFQKKINTGSRKEMEDLLKDLKAKGVDLIGLIIRKMINDNGWFD